MSHPVEFKVVAMRECPVETPIVDEPELAAAYWRKHIATDKRYCAEQEQVIVLILNARKRIKGHQLVGLGAMDSVTIHPREVFRAAVIYGASAIVIMHNHPSGDPTPSEADIKITRDLIRAGRLIGVQVLDHIVMGQPTKRRSKGYCSLRELGYTYE